MRSALPSMFAKAIPCAGGLLLGAATLASGGALAQRDVGVALERAHAAAREGRPWDSADLRAVLARLRSDYEAQRHRFEKAAARPLPTTAAERLAGARQAYAQGHGRLIDLIARAVEAPAGPEQLSWLAEAEALHDHIESAGAPLVISAEARVRPPHIVAPPLPAAGAPAAPAPPEALVFDAVPAPLRQAADALAGPIEVFEWVRNQLRPDFYHGFMKGALGAFHERSANDADSAAVLVEMLRAKGVPARYAYGVAEMPAATLVALTGTADVQQAVRVLARAGVPHEAVAGPGGTAFVRLHRVWVEAYLPYANYRGAVIDSQGSVWLSLDPAFKPMGTPAGLDVVAALGFDTQEFLDQYLATAQSATPRERIRAHVSELLTTQLPGTTYDDVLNRRLFEAQRLGLLPSTLPYKVVAIAGVSYDPDAALRHRVRVLGTDSEGPLFDVEVDTADVLGHRVTLAYEPATDDDAHVVALHGGLHLTPPYLVEVRPVLKVGGLPVGAGSRGIGMAVRYALRVDLQTPGGVESIENMVQAGNLVAIGLAARQQGQAPTETTAADQILASVATKYFGRWNASDEELADLLRVVPVRPTLSACLAQSDIEVEYAGGDPLYPLTFDWKGILVDVDLRASAPVGLETTDAESRFLTVSGLEGSVLEERVFSEHLGIAAVSTAGALGLAPSQGLVVHELTQENVDDVLPGLPFDAAVKEEIRDAALGGMSVRVPSGFVTRHAWRGVGYLLLDEQMGEAAWQLQGGHSGGVTTPAVIAIPAEIRDLLIEQGQSLEPAPADAVVRSVQKFVSTDFQEATVGHRLDVPLRVLVTDEQGRVVQGANVVFSIMGGDSVLQDPAPGGLTGSQVTVRSDEHGEAEVIQWLGTSTSVLPRLVIFPNPELEPLQVGLNLVTVRAGSATLAEPFSTFALPDYRLDDSGQALGIFEWMPGPVLPLMPQLSVAGRLGLQVADQHGNPLSNFITRFEFRPPPVQLPPPEGMSLTRPATTTPGRLLTPADYQQCLSQHLHPNYGECAGEAPSVEVKSTHLGVFSYASLGDSPWSAYTFEVSTTIEPVGWISLHTSAYLCIFEDVSLCEGYQAPYEPFIATGVRPIRINRLGNFTEAYPPGGEGPFLMWAESVGEIEQVVRETDPQGNEHFIAVGSNAWRRERLTDSEVRLTPETPGSGVIPDVAVPRGDGTYEARLRMALEPQLNKLRFAAKHWPLRLDYLDGHWPELDPAHVDPVTLEAERIQFMDVPIQTSGGFELWGIAPALTSLNPTPVHVGPEGTVSRASTVTAQIAPAAYSALLAPQDVLFEIRRDGQRVLAANGNSGSFEVPVGLPLPDDLHDAVLSVVGMAKTAQGFEDIHSPPMDLPRCDLLKLETPFVSIPMAVDFVNGTSCAQDGLLKFSVCEAARVTLRVDGEVYEGQVLGLPGPNPPLSVRIEDLELPPGEYTVVFPPTYLGPNVLEQKPFVLGAVSLEDPTRRTETAGVVANSARNRAVLPVGRTFVKGVDLLDGHVVRSHSDLELPGRHLSLAVQRTYSSAGADRAGLLGAGWAFSYESRLYVTPCGVIVQTAEGSSQLFRSTDGGLTFVPQKGYHTRLRKNVDVSYDFFDKAGNRHHFEPPNPQAPEGSQRLLYIEEPHGDRIVLDYDLTGRLARVGEIQAGDTAPVRQLDIRYVRRGGHDRISSIRAPGQDVIVEYFYDEWGNLKEIRRNGPPARRERYEYTAVNARDRHQLLEVRDANDHVTRYEYFQAAAEFPGQASAPLPVHNEEYVRRVVEHPAGGAGPVATEFSYDLTEVLALRWQTTVRDGRGVDTRYVMNGNGGDIERHEAVDTTLERTTTSEWAENDILKVRTIDPAGRVAEYGHDSSGNLILEETTTADLGVVRRSWLYGPFNKLIAQTDAANRTTMWEIDPANGDVLSTTDAAGNMTRFEYLSGNHGLIAREIDPRGNAVEHSDHDSFGNARVLQGPGPRVITRVFDARGRLLGENDNLGHQLGQQWDGLDRVVQRRRVSGADSDEVYAWEYYAGGQKRAETNPLGARTEFTLDGLGRVIRETTLASPEVLTVERSYDANGNLLLERDRRGVRKAWTYDELNRAVEVRILTGPAPGPTGVVSRSGYDSVDRKLFEIDLAGLRSDFEYDGLYRVKKKLLPETCPYGRCFEAYGYDLAGNRTSFRDLGGFTETTVYDGVNRVTSFTDRAGRTRTTEYNDPEGSHVHKSAEHDPFGLVTTWLYDELGRETNRSLALTGGGSQGEIYVTATGYDDAAHAVVITDPRGNRIRRQLDGLDRVTREVADVDGLALETLFTWDGLSNRTSTRDPEGHLTRSIYDALGRLREVEDALGRRSLHMYDGGGLRIRDIDRRSVRTDLSYDNLGRLLRTAVVPSLTNVAWSASTTYLDEARRRIETDARGKQTTIELDGLGRPVRIIDPAGEQALTEWLGTHDRRERDKRGFWRELRFDGIGRPTLVRDPGPFEAQTYTTAYHDPGNRVTETDRRGIVRVTQKDSLQRVRSVTRASVLLEEHGYDGNGNRVSSRDAVGRETRLEFDGANRMVTRTDGFDTPDAAVTRFEHDGDGNVTIEKDQRAADLGEPFSVRRTYDPLHRVSTVTDGEQNVTAYGYDEEGHRTSVAEPGLQVTTFAYGEKGELRVVTQPAASVHSPAITRVVYDESRNPTKQHDARGNEVEMSWDDLGRLDRRTQLGAPEGSLVTDPSYDPNGNQILLVDPKGQAVTQVFDELNRLKEKAWDFAPGDPLRPWRYIRRMLYEWDENNNLERVTECVVQEANARSSSQSGGATCSDP